MRHFATQDYWFYYRLLPSNIQDLADKNFALLKDNPRHPSLRLKKVSHYWSVRIGISYRALGKSREEGVVWFWIGTHAEYDLMIKG